MSWTQMNAFVLLVLALLLCVLVFVYLSKLAREAWFCIVCLLDCKIQRNTVESKNCGIFACIWSLFVFLMLYTTIFCENTSIDTVAFRKILSKCYFRHQKLKYLINVLGVLHKVHKFTYFKYWFRITFSTEKSSKLL